MVAIVSGGGLGLIGMQRLGGAGVIGSSATGAVAENLYVNAANGNLIVRRQDDFLLSRGVDLGLVRTYNSQGLLNDDNGDNWNIGVYRQVRGLTGTRNRSGSTIKRIDADGNEEIYVFDDTRNLYVRTDDPDADDTLAFDEGQQQWIWLDGATQVRETYQWEEAQDSGRLTALRDANGNAQTYAYDPSGLLNHITLASGESVYLDYTGNELDQIRIVDALGNVLESTHYQYDNVSRLSTVYKEWQQPDGTLRRYTINYRYDGASRRLAGLSEVDAAADQSRLADLAFTYEQQSDGSYRIKTITDRLQRVTQFDYDLVNHKTTVTDALNGLTEFTHDAQGRLSTLDLPAMGNGRQRLQYLYNADGKLEKTIDARNQAVIYGYDARGNRTSQLNPDGSSIEWVYDAQNRLLSETLHGNAGDPTTRSTYYRYDGAGNLRFELSPDGRVVEHLYNGFGERIATLRYGKELYALDQLGIPDEAALAAWVATRRDTGLQRTEFQYGFRGQVEWIKTYSATLADGSGDTTRPIATTHYLYSHDGRLLGQTDSNGRTSSYAYDAMGRLLASQEGGLVTTREYTHGGHTLITHQSDGLTIVEQYDAARQLISVALGANQPTTYAYDALGNLRLVTDPTGIKTMALYDAAGRKVADIDGAGRMTEYRYNKNNQLVHTIRYANALTEAQLTALETVVGDTAPLFDAINDLAPWRPLAQASEDRNEWTLYNDIGQPAKTINAAGQVTEYLYDAAGALVATIRHAVPVTAQWLADFTLDTTAADLQMTYTADARVERTIYGKDGQVLATIDDQGSLTEHIYDAAGLLIKTTRYANRTRNESNPPDLTPDLNQIRPAPNPQEDQHTYRRYDARGLMVAQIDAESYLTEFEYDNAGNQTLVKRYAGRTEGLAPDTASIDALRAQALLGGSPQLTQYTYNNQGLVATQTNPDGTIAVYEYDERGRMTKKFAASGTIEQRVTEWRYNSLGQLEQEIDARGKFISYVYDDAGRLTQTMDREGNLVWYYYDDKTGQLTHTINSLGEVHTRLHNNFLETRQEIAYTARLGSGAVASLQGGFASSALKTEIAALYNSQKDSLVDYTYTTLGQLAMRFGNGSRINYQYNLFGELEAQTEQDGPASTFHYDRLTHSFSTSTRLGTRDLVTTTRYDAFGRVIETEDARGGITGFQYDRLGRQVRIDVAQDSGIASSHTVYDAFNRTETHTDALGHTTQYHYDVAARAATITTAGGISVTTYANRHGQTRDIIDGRGNSTRYEYDDNGLLLSVRDQNGRLIEGREYDDNGNQTLSIDGVGNNTRYEYDAAGRQFKVITDPGLNRMNLTTTTVFDGRGQATSTTDANGIVTERDYYPSGQLKEIRIDPNGLNLRTQFTYDAAGNMLTVVEGAGSATPKTTRYQYNELGQRIQETRDPNGLAISTQYTYDANGNLVAKTDANGKITRYGYDAQNQLIWEIDPTGAATENRYDANGNLIETLAHGRAATGLPAPDAMAQAANWASSLTIAPHPDDRTTRRLYDADNRLQYVIGNAREVIGYTYDANNNLIAERRYASTAWTLVGDTLTIAQSADDRTLQTVYDHLNRARFTVDSQGRVVEKRYDDAGKLQTEIAYADTVAPSASWTIAALTAQLNPGALDRSVAYEYDAANRLVKTTDAMGRITRYGYDAVGRQTSVTQQATAAPADPDNRITRIVYDAAGRQVYNINPLGLVTEFQYDATDNIVKTIVHGQAVAVPSGPLTVAVIAALLPVNAADRIETVQHDAAGRVTRRTDALGRTTDYGYDMMGRVTMVTQRAKQALWDAANRVWTPQGASTDDRTTRTVYNDAGRIAFTEDPMGRTTGIEHNIFGEITVTTAYIDRGEWNGNVYTIPQTSNEDRRTAIVKDLAKHITYLVDAEGRVTAQHEDNLGNVTKTVNFAGTVTGWTSRSESATALTAADLETLGNSTASQNRVSRSVYNTLGEIIYTEDPEHRTIGYERNAFGNVTVTTAYVDRGEWNGDDYTIPQTGNADRRMAIVDDPANRRRYLVDQEGRVVCEYLNAFGEVERQIRFAAPVTGWTSRSESATALTAADLETLGNSTASQNRMTRTVYNLAGEVTYTEDAEGRTTGIEHNIFGEITVTTAYIDRGEWNGNVYTIPQTSNEDRRTAIVKDLAKHITYLVDAEGRVTAQHEDNLGNVTKTVNFAGTVTGWSRRGESATALTAADLETLGNSTASANRVTRTAYNLAGEITYTEDAEGRATGIARNALGEVTVTTAYVKTGSWSGNVYTPPQATPTNSTEPDVVDRRSATVRDAQKHITYLVGADGHVTARHEDNHGNVIKVVQFAAGIAGWTSHSESAAALTTGSLEALADTSAASQDRVTRFAFNKAGQTLYTQNPQGETTGIEYDALGDVNITRHYINRGQWSEEGLYTPPASSNDDRRTAQVRNLRDHITYLVDGEGRVTAQHEDHLGNVIKIVQFAAGIAGWTNHAEAADALTADSLNNLADADDDRTSRIFHNQNGEATAEVDATGNTKVMIRDPFGAVIKTIERYQKAHWNGSDWELVQPDSDDDRISEMTYNANGELTAHINAMGMVTVMVHDNFGQLTQTIQRYNNALWEVDHWRMQPEDPQKDRVTQMFYNKTGQETARVDAAGKTLVTVYDKFGAVRQIINRYNAAKWIDSEKRWELPPEKMTGFNNVDGQFRTYDQVSQVVYDKAGQMVASIDAEGATTVFTYTDFGERKQSIVRNTKATWQTTPKSWSLPVADSNTPTRDRTRETRYNADGQITHDIDTDGVTIERAYDKFGALSKIITHASRAIWLAASKTWQLPQSSTQDRVKQMFYNDNGEIVAEVGSDGATVMTVHGAFGESRQSILCADKAHWNGADWELPTQDYGTDRVAETFYNKAGQVTARVHFDGSTEVIVHGAFGETYQSVLRANNALWEDTHWTLRAADPAHDRVTTHLRDDAGRLIAEIDAVRNTRRYEYDNFGQLKLETQCAGKAQQNADGSWSLPSADLAHDHSITRIYNAVGDVIATIGTLGDTQLNEYDTFGVLTKRTEFAQRAQRNAQGEWVLPGATAGSDRIEHFVHDNLNREVYKIDAKGTITKAIHSSFGEVLGQITYANAFDGSVPYTVQDVRSYCSGHASSDDRGISWVYNPRGQVEYLVRSDGAVTRYEYDNDGNQTKVSRYSNLLTSSGGFAWNISDIGKAEFYGVRTMAPGAETQVTENIYDALGHVVYIINPVNGVTELQYNDFGEKIGEIQRAVSLPATTARTATAISQFYANAGNVKNAEDRHSVHFYDAASRPLYSVDGSGAVTQYLYGIGGELVSTIQLAKRLDNWSVTASTTIGALDNLSREGARVTTVLRDIAGQEIYRIDGEGYVVETLYTHGQVSGSRRYMTSIGATARTLEAIEAFYNDPLHRTENDRRTALVVGKDSANRVVRYTIDTAGRAVREVLNAHDEVIRITRFADILDAWSADSATPDFATLEQTLSLEGAQTEAFVRDAHGNVTWTINQLGWVERSDFNAFGKIAKHTRYAATLPNWSATGTPDLTALNALSTTDARVNEYFYDEASRLAIQIGPQNRMEWTQYDALDRVNKKIAFVTPVPATYVGNLRAYVHLKTLTTDNVFQIDRNDDSRNPPPVDYDRSERYHYFAGTTSYYHVDILGRMTRYDINAFGDIVKTIQAGIANTTYSVNTTYSLSGIETYFNQAGARTTQTFHDLTGRERFTLDAFGGVRETLYDAEGNIAQQIAYPAVYTGAKTMDALQQWAQGQKSSARSETVMADLERHETYHIDGIGQVTVEVHNALGVTQTLRLAVTLDNWSAASTLTLSQLRNLSRAGARIQQEVIYDAGGNAVYAIGADGSVTETTYHPIYGAQATRRYAVLLGSTPRTLQAIAEFYSTRRDDQKDRHTCIYNDRDAATGYLLRYTVNEQGAVVRATIDTFGQVLATVAYADRIDDWPAAAVTLDKLRNLSATGARKTEQVYNVLGQLLYSVDAQNYVTAYTYTRFDQVTRQLRYTVALDAATPRTAASITAYYAMVVNGVAVNQRDTDRLSVTLYYKDGAESYTVGPMGEVTLKELNVFGELTKTTQFSAKVPNWTANSTVTKEYLNNRTNIPLTGARITQYGYDQAGRLIQVTDPANAVTLTTYNGMGDVTKVVQQAGATANAALDRRTATRLYYANGNLKYEIDGAGNVTRHEYDVTTGQLSRTIRYAQKLANWDSNSTVNETTLDGWNPEGARIEQLVYDAFGMAEYTIDGANTVTRITRDAFGQITARITYAQPLPAEVGRNSTAIGQFYQIAANRSNHDRRTASVYNVIGQPVYTVAADGQVSAITYDDWGNILTVTQSAVAVANWTANAVFTDENALVAAITTALAAPGARTENRLYDAHGRLSAVVDYRGRAVVSQYDDFNQVTLQIQLAEPISSAASPAPLASQIALQINNVHNRKTAVVYDNEGRIVVNVGYRGDVTVRQLNTFGEAQQVTECAQNIDWNSATPLATQIATVSAANAANRVTMLTYDGNGRVITQKDALNRETVYQYNAFGDVVLETRKSSAGDRRQVRTYDRAGRLSATVDALGRITGFSYDTWNQVVVTTQYKDAVTWSSTAADPLAQITQDINARLTTGPGEADRKTGKVYNLRGDLIADINGVGVLTTYVVNAFGDTTSTVNRFASVSWTSATPLAQQVAAIVASPNAADRTSSAIVSADGHTLYSVNPGGAIRRTTTNAFGQTIQTVDYATALPDATARNQQAIEAFLAARPSGAAANDRIQSIVRNATGSVEYHIDAEGYVVKLESDHFGQPTRRIAFDERAIAGSTPTLEFLDMTFSPADASITQTVYNDKGQAIYEIGPLGYVKRKEYDGFNQLTGIQEYTTPLAAGVSRTVADIAQFFATHPDAQGQDRFSAIVYDLAGQVRFDISPAAAVTEYRYSGFGEVTGKIEHAVLFTGMLAQWGPDKPHALSNLEAAYPVTTVDADDRYSAMVYRADGSKLYEVNPMGYVVAYENNPFGQIAVVKRYWNPVSNWSPATALPADAAALVTPNDSLDRRTVTVFDAAGSARFAVDGEHYVTETLYNSFGQIEAIKQYPNKLTYFGAGATTTVAEMEAQRYALSAAPVGGIPGLTVTPATTTFKYDRNGQTTETTRLIDATNAITTRNEYDAFGQVTLTTYAYDTSDASATRQSYDRLGRLIEATVAYGTSDAATTRHRYIDNDIVEVIDPRGIELAEGISEWAKTERALLGYPREANLLNAQQKEILLARYTVRQELNRNGQVIRIVQPNGLVTRQDYDAFGNIIKTSLYERTASGDQYKAGYDNHFEYNQLNQRTYQRDAGNRLTQISYTAFGEISQIVKVEAHSGASDEFVTISHDKLGNQTSVSTRLGDQTSAIRGESETRNAFDEIKTRSVQSHEFGIASWEYEYDRRGLLTRETLPVKSTNAAGQLVTVINRHEYDARGNRIKTIEASGLEEERITEFGYDLLDRQISKTSQQVWIYDEENNTDSNQARVESYAYDRRGNRIRTTISAKGAASTNDTTTRVYYNLRNQQNAELNAVGTLTTRQLDVVGNAWLIKVYGQTVTALPDGSLPAQENLPTECRETEFRYDIGNRLLEARVKDVLLGEYNSNLAGGPGYIAYNGDIRTGNTYDLLGNLIKTVDARGGVSRFFYDNTGRKTGELDASGYLTTWDYLTVSQTGEDDARGLRVVQTRYGQAIGANDNDSLTTVRTRAYQAAFPSGQNPPPANWMPPSAAQPSHIRITTSFTNSKGEVTEQRVWLGNNAYGPIESVTQYTRNGLGEVATIKDGDGMWTRFEYDALGRLVRQTIALDQMVNSDGRVVATPSSAVEMSDQMTDTVYNGLGLVKKQIRLGFMAYDNRITENAYDKLGQLVSRSSYKGDANDPQKQTVYFNYNLDGHQTSSYRVVTNYQGTEEVQGIVTGYNKIGQVVRTHTEKNFQWLDGTLEEMRYNAYGEMTQKGRYKPADGVPQQLQAFFEYNKQGQLVRTNADNGVVKVIMYDGQGNATLTLQGAGQYNLRDKSLAQTLAEFTNAANDTSLLSQVNLTITVYDAANRAIQTLQPNSGVADVVQKLASQVRDYDNGSQGVILNVNGATQTPATGSLLPRRTRLQRRRPRHGDTLYLAYESDRFLPECHTVQPHSQRRWWGR